MPFDSHEWSVVRNGDQLRHEWHWRDTTDDFAMNLIRRSGQLDITKGQTTADPKAGTMITYMLRRLEQELSKHTPQSRIFLLRQFAAEADRQYFSGEYTDFGGWPPKLLVYCRYLWYHPEQPLYGDGREWSCELRYREHLDMLEEMLAPMGLTAGQYWAILFCEPQWFESDRMEVDEEEPVGPRGEVASQV